MPSIERTIGGQSRRLDARPDRVDLRDRIYQPKLKTLPPTWPPQQVIDSCYGDFSRLILDQGNEGACTGFGLAAMIHYLRFKDYVTGLGQKKVSAKAIEDLRVSTRMLYELARLYDEWQGEDYEGSSCRGAMKGWHRHGVCSEALWKFDPSGGIRPQQGWELDAANLPLGAYYRIDKDSLVDMQSAIREVGAIYVSATVHTGWNLSKAKKIGNFSLIRISGEPSGGHAFAIVGYNRDGFIVQNSWGKKWGYNGFAVLGYEDWVANGLDAWVAALGAPMAVGESAAFVDPNEFVSPFEVQDRLGRAKAKDCGGAHPGIWKNDVAYAHSMVIGNEGFPHRSKVASASAVDQIKIDLFDRVNEWLSASPGNRDVVIFAHGGLNSEPAAIRRVCKLGPFFLSNGVFPIFVVWKTGVLESLLSMGEDLMDWIVRGHQGVAEPVGGPKEWLSSAWDRTAEVTLRPLGLGLWSEMKENAKASTKDDHGADLLGRGLTALSKNSPGLRIHLIGHSAGSIWLGRLLDTIRKQRNANPATALLVNSCHLYAAACTVKFGLKHYVPAVKDGTLPAKRFFNSFLSDTAEQNDTVAKIYRKSLLYFVSRACEKSHKTPILGMEAAWDGGLDKKDVFGTSFAADLKAWRAFTKSVGIVPARIVPAYESISTGCKPEGPTHGGFDNDLLQITNTLKRIRRSNAALPQVVNCLADC